MASFKKLVTVIWLDGRTESYLTETENVQDGCIVVIQSLNRVINIPLRNIKCYIIED